MLSSTPRPKLLITIVNYCTSHFVIKCLCSLDDEIPKNGDIFVEVVDNHSQDNSEETLRKAIKDHHWESWVNLRISPQNKGFAEGSNFAIIPHLHSATPPDYVLLLNPDTEVRPGAIKNLITFMDAHPQVGIAGSRIENMDGTARYSAFRFPTATSEFLGGASFGLFNRLLSRWTVIQPIQSQPHSSDWVSGACMMIRREVFDTIGFMDDHYFLYYEETDFCLRAKRAGWECWYVPHSIVVHHVGQSSQVTGEHNSNRRLPHYWFFSRRYFFRTNYGIVYALWTDMIWLIGATFGIFKRLLRRKKGNNRPHLLRDFIYYTFFPRGLKQ